MKKEFNKYLPQVKESFRMISGEIGIVVIKDEDSVLLKDLLIYCKGKISLNEMNYILNINKLDMIEAVTKAHIAMDIISNKTNEKQLLKQFGHIPSKGEFIETIMNENCPAYVKKKTVTPKEVAEIIRKAGGKVVLAHPVAYVHEDNLTMNEILEIINDMKADGLEANYIYTDRNNNIVNEIEKWNKFAEENHLFVTIGSDFHMEDGNHAEIGLENVGVVLEDEKADEILEKIK